MRAYFEIEDMIFKIMYEQVMTETHGMIESDRIIKNPKLDPRLGKDWKEAEQIAQKYWLRQLTHYSDFEWGVIVGSLQALHWIMGQDWADIHDNKNDNPFAKDLAKMIDNIFYFDPYREFGEPIWDQDDDPAERYKYYNDYDD